MAKNYRSWTMRDGTKINIADMTEEHLRNTINMITRKMSKKQLQDTLDSYIKEERKRQKAEVEQTMRREISRSLSRDSFHWVSDHDDWLWK